MIYLLALIGAVLLLWGADRLVDGASSLARRLGLSPLLIGLTIVAMGTSTPELAVSVTAAFQGKGDLAIGNVVGSNLCNILLILGLSGVIAPLMISPKLVRFDVPVMIIAALAVMVLGFDSRFGLMDGLTLLVLAVIYIGISVYRGRQTSAALLETESGKSHSLKGSIGLVVLGLICLVIGSTWMVAGASALARLLGMSELIIGLTVVAVGTSLPEIATSVIAALRGKGDIAVGNVVGSNILNVLVILGSSAVVSGSNGLAIGAGIQQIDGPLMLVASIACLPLFWSGYVLARIEAVILLFGYALYTAWCLSGSFPEARPAIKGIAVCYALAAVVIIALPFVYRRSSAQQQ